MPADRADEHATLGHRRGLGGDQLVELGSSASREARPRPGSRPRFVTLRARQTEGIDARLWVETRSGLKDKPSATTATAARETGTHGECGGLCRAERHRDPIYDRSKNAAKRQNPNGKRRSARRESEKKLRQAEVFADESQPRRKPDGWPTASSWARHNSAVSSHSAVQRLFSEQLVESGEVRTGTSQRPRSGAPEPQHGGLRRRDESNRR